MPIQKGKHHRKPRRRGERAVAPMVEESPPVRKVQPVAKKTGGFFRPLGMRGNALMGLVMLVVGLFLFATPTANTPQTMRIVFLVGYLGVAGFYLTRAFLQYRAGS